MVNQIIRELESHDLSIDKHTKEVTSRSATSKIPLVVGFEQRITTREIAQNITQAAATADVSKNITSVNEVTAQVARGAKECENASKDLAKLGTEILAAVAQFKV